jgi:hypothetical protein
MTIVTVPGEKIYTVTYFYVKMVTNGTGTRERRKNVIYEQRKTDSVGD